MQTAENNIRKKSSGKKKNANIEKFVASERLRILGLHLREDIRRFKEPANIKTNKINQDRPQDIEQTLGDGFFKLKTK